MLGKRDLGLFLYMEYHAVFFYIKRFISMSLITDQEIILKNYKKCKPSCSKKKKKSQILKKYIRNWVLALV